MDKDIDMKIMNWQPQGVVLRLERRGEGNWPLKILERIVFG